MTETTLTPFEFRILLHYYVSPQKYEDRYWYCDILFRTKYKLVGFELLNYTNKLPNDERTFFITDAGKLYIETALSLPLPVRIWVMPK